MKNRGFTLIELLGVIMILGILALITFPPILEQIKNSKQEIKNSTKILITDAAKDYYEDNINNYEKTEGITYCIDINTLTDNGYLNKKIKDENINDISNTKKVKMIYHNNKFEYDVVDSCTKYTVTFDANGGSVDIDSKEVIQDSVYGELPTPARAGYTFMGWNGKNMLDFESWLNSFSTATRGTIVKDNNTIMLTATANDAYTNTYGDASSFKIMVEPNKNYTFSWSSDSNKTGLQYIFLNGQASSGNAFNSNGSKNNRTFLTKNDTNYINIRFGVSTADDSITYSNAQIEEGETATDYEPYYITSDTKVVQQKDHTLKAIWKAN